MSKMIDKDEEKKSKFWRTWQKTLKTYLKLLKLTWNQLHLKAIWMEQKFEKNWNAGISQFCLRFKQSRF